MSENNFGLGNIYGPFRSEYEAKDHIENLLIDKDKKAARMTLNENLRAYSHDGMILKANNEHEHKVALRMQREILEGHPEATPDLFYTLTGMTAHEWKG